jgi:MoxR-like ATPase
LLCHAQAEVGKVKVERTLFNYVLELTRRTRDWPAISLGASPRAAISLLTASKAIAAVDGREYLIPDDVKAALLPALRHRILLKPEAELEGMTVDQVLGDVLNAIEVPR